MQKNNFKCTAKRNPWKTKQKQLTYERIPEYSNHPNSYYDSKKTQGLYDSKAICVF
jgi:transposase